MKHVGLRIEEIVDRQIAKRARVELHQAAIDRCRIGVHGGRVKAAFGVYDRKHDSDRHTAARSVKQNRFGDHPIAGDLGEKVDYSGMTDILAIQGVHRIGRLQQIGHVRMLRRIAGRSSRPHRGGVVVPYKPIVGIFRTIAR